MITVCLRIPVWLDAFVSLPAYRPAVFPHLAVRLHGSSLADDQQAADGSRGAGAAAESQDARRAVLCLLQQHGGAAERVRSVSKVPFSQN